MLATWIWDDKHLGLFQHLKFNILLLCEICNIRDPETSSTTVPNKIYLKESWIASLSLAMTILKIRNVIAKECICTTVAIHFCYFTNQTQTKTLTEYQNQFEFSTHQGH